MATKRTYRALARRLGEIRAGIALGSFTPRRAITIVGAENSAEAERIGYRLEGFEAGIEAAIAVFAEDNSRFNETLFRQEIIAREAVIAATQITVGGVQ